MELIHIGGNVYINTQYILEVDAEEKTLTFTNGRKVCFSPHLWEKVWAHLRRHIVLDES